MLYQWTWDDTGAPGLDSSLITTTGDVQPNLVVRPDILSAGATVRCLLPAICLSTLSEHLIGSQYTFSLRATYLGSSSSTNVVVTMNSAPYGGSLTVSPDPPYTALLSELTLTASQWTDDASDLPLEYSFSYADASVGGTHSLTSGCTVRVSVRVEGGSHVRVMLVERSMLCPRMRVGTSRARLRSQRRTPVPWLWARRL